MVSLCLLKWVILSALLLSAESIEKDETFYIESLCSLKGKIENSCRKRVNLEIIDRITCNNQVEGERKNYCMYKCSRSMSERLLFTLSRQHQSYYCNLLFNKTEVPTAMNTTSYEIQYFDCEWLNEVRDSDFTPELYRGRFSDISMRRMQSSSKIMLNLYSNPLPSKTYVLHVMNKCSLDYSWPCKDSSNIDVISSGQLIPFSKVGSNSYLSAEYDLDPIHKDSLSMEVLSLYQGGIRKECWGNTNFQGVPTRKEYSKLVYISSRVFNYLFYGSLSVSCRITGYYKATYTGDIQVKFAVNGTANAWILDESIEPNFPDLKYFQVYKKTITVIKDNYYYLRIDYKSISLSDVGIPFFNITVPGVSDATVSLNNLYYPIRTDYSLLDLNSIALDDPTFIPVPETNGVIVCPISNPSCSTLSYSQKIADTKFNPFCEDYIWENGIQICERCKTNAIIIDNICSCRENYWQNSNTLQCVAVSTTNYRNILYKVIYIQKAFETGRNIILVISNPCTSSEIWTCESTQESSLLMASIFQNLPIHYNEYRLYISLNTLGMYSMHFNILTSQKLHLVCWNEPNFSGSIVCNQGQAFSNSFVYAVSYKSCRWEGFIMGIAFGDLEFVISGTSSAKLWIKNDVHPVIIYSCCTPVSYRIRMAKELYYYIRLDITDPANLLKINLQYKSVPIETLLTISVANMYQPIRMNMGILTGNPNMIYNIASNTPENNVYYCPLPCTSCTFSIFSSTCTGCIDNAYIKGVICECNETRYFNDELYKCEKCSPLCKSCTRKYRYSLCTTCFQNAFISDYTCKCNSGYTEDFSTNTCITTTCHIEISPYKLLPYNYSETLLEITDQCQTVNGILCEATSPITIHHNRRLVSFAHSDTKISVGYDIPDSSSFTISVLQLTSGNFLLEKFQAANWTGTPDSSVSTLSINIPKMTKESSFRLQGYVKFPITGIYDISFSNNVVGKVYFDSMDYDLLLNQQFGYISNNLIGNRYYNLRVDFLGRTDRDLNLKITYKFNSTYYDLNSDKIYYTDNSTISRWNIASCNSTIYTSSYKNGLRYCPLLCVSCDLRVNKCQGCANEVCDVCVENAHLESDKCICNDGYYSASDSESCTKCPDTCKTCDTVNGSLECQTCIKDGEVKLGGCACKGGYYLISDPNVSCNVCPDLCMDCSLMKPDVVCDICIENAHKDSDGCVCNLGYSKSSVYPSYCYKFPELCTGAQDTEGNIECIGCVENAYIENSKCVCNLGFYGSLTQEDVCDKCPETCILCKKENSEVICESCIDMYYLSILNPGKCLICTEYCTKCEESNGHVMCLECFETFYIVNGKCLCDPEDYFILKNECNMKPFMLNYSSEQNIIKLFFSKHLLNGLNPIDLNIKYPEYFNSTILTYSIKSIVDNYSYMLEFYYLDDIDQTIVIQVKFSDEVTDRQFTHLSNDPANINLILYYQEKVYEYGCNDLCKECYFDICMKCIDFAYLDDVKCICYSGLKSENTCKDDCPENMKIDKYFRTCLPTNSTIQTEPESEPEPETSEYSPEEIAKAKQYSEASSSVSNTSTYTSVVLSLLTSSLDNAWSLMNTIQIFIYLPLINIEIPLALRESLLSQDNSKQISELFKDYLPEGPAPYKQAYESGFKTGLFLYNSAKPILTILIMLNINAIIFFLHKISRGRIKELLGKILSLFYYGIYLRFFLQMYMDLAISAFIQVLTVFYIQPSSEEPTQILSYIVSLLLLILKILSPYILSVFIYFNRTRLQNEDFLKIWGTLFSEFRINENRICCIYYILFLIRRLILSLSNMIFRNYPIIQIAMISGSSWNVRYIQVFLFVLVFRPFKTRVFNSLQILNELGISLGYSMCSIFLIDTGLDDIYKIWIILSTVYFCYLIHIFLILAKFLKLILTKLQNWLRSSSKKYEFTLNN